MKKQKPEVIPTIPDAPVKSFASVLSEPTLPILVRSNIPGSYQAVKINSELYKKRLAICQFSLIGRVVLSKGDSPWTLVKLKEKLASLWNLKSSWHLISLGRGFFHILLTSDQDRDSIWSRGSLTLKPGVMSLQRWFSGFDPFKEKSTSTQLWMRLYRLP